MRDPRRTLVAALMLATIVAACIPTPAARETPTPSGSPAGSAAATTPAPGPTGPSGPPSFIRPTPTPLPTFLVYVVKAGDNLGAIARAHGTTPRSIAFWNRSTYPSLDPDSPTYEPDAIKVGWTLLLIPNLEVDPEDFP